MTALETYLRSLHDRRGHAVPETTTYGLLESLLNSAGHTLQPKVKAVTHPKQSGAGIPDMGLFAENDPDGQKPTHGVLEVKPTDKDLPTVARSQQVAGYVAEYGLVLVTNLYQFILVTRGPDGTPSDEERYDLAASEAEFWTQTPAALGRAHDAALGEYFKRVMLRKAPLASPQDVAWILASYARQAKARLDVDQKDHAALSLIKNQLEAALGVRFQDEAAEEFFRSTLVQTLFYGIFSAWVLWHERTRSRPGRFDLWRDTRRLNVPVVQELFEQFSAAGALPSSIEKIMEWTADALNRVDRAAFFERFNTGHAIQYFYEPFLEAFDPDLRRQLGVWYTPPEVVDYMVAKVDAALKTDLNIPDGLADPNVVILDPCCGTGAYLIAVLRRIYQTAERRDGPVLAAQTVQAALRERVFGFEILPAPFVIAHLQAGILLDALNAPLNAGQRAGIFLTNALTGLEPAETPKQQVLLAELQRERDTANAVKQAAPILVILGNPPYSGYAGLAMDEERDLTNAYRATADPRLPRPEGHGLNDPYIRFYRMAERRIVERSGRGIVCFISNYSWLDGQSHPGMRERYLNAFDKVFIDNLHGDRIISEYAPDGRSSETIFAMRGTSPGIKLGTAIATMIAKGGDRQTCVLYYRDFNEARAEERRAALLDSLNEIDPHQSYRALTPTVEVGLPFKPLVISENYLTWPKLPDLFPVSFSGVKTSRDADLVSIDREPLNERMKQYFDPSIPHSTIGQIAPSLMRNSARFNATAVRETLLRRGLLPENIVRYIYRPLDVRWLYWEPETKLLDEKRSDYFPHVRRDNAFLFTTGRTRKNMIEPPILSSVLVDLNLMDSVARGFPMFLYKTAGVQRGLFDEPDGPERTANLSKHAAAYLDGLGIDHEADAALLFYHALAVLHSAAYRVENAGALRQDWPRVPLPDTRDRLQASAELGREVAALLEVESDVPGVTSGDPRSEVAGIATLTTLDNRPPDFNITVNWGYFGQGAIVMAGRGRIQQHDGLVDVYLNDTTCWRDIPQAVWAYTLGGYQVLKKWLSYRETAVLGRPLRHEEARTFMHIARRIAALLALGDALDLNYRGLSSAEAFA